MREALEARREELERAILARVQALAERVGEDDTEYAQGLRDTVPVAVAYGIEAIEHEVPPPTPPQLLEQACLAARRGVPLDAVLRRYFAGHALLSDRLVEVLEEGEGVSPLALKRAMRNEARAFDHVLVTIAQVYAEQTSVQGRTWEERRGEMVRRVLAGEAVETAELEYEWKGWHVALLVASCDARRDIRGLASALDRSALIVSARDGRSWVWLGGTSPLDSGDVLRRAESHWPSTNMVAIGEPGEGLDGWRRSHAQAKAAMRVAAKSSHSIVRYVDVALVAAALADEVLGASLEENYMRPLCAERDGGEALRQTLAAYFKVGRNVSSTAALLGVNRKTIGVRLKAIERLLGRPVDDCAAELETALKLWALERNGTLP